MNELDMRREFNKLLAMISQVQSKICEADANLDTLSDNVQNFKVAYLKEKEGEK